MPENTVANSEQPSRVTGRSVWDVLDEALQRNPSGLIAGTIAGEIHERGVSYTRMNPSGNTRMVKDVAERNITYHPESVTKIHIVPGDSQNRVVAIENIAGGSVVKEGLYVSTKGEPELVPLTTIHDKKDEPPDVGKIPKAQTEEEPEVKTEEAPNEQGCCTKVMTGINIFFRNLCPTVRNFTLCECCNINFNLCS